MVKTLDLLRGSLRWWKRAVNTERIISICGLVASDSVYIHVDDPGICEDRDSMLLGRRPIDGRTDR